MDENHIRDGDGGHKIDGDEAHDDGDDNGEGEMNSYFAGSEVQLATFFMGQRHQQGWWPIQDICTLKVAHVKLGLSVCRSKVGACKQSDRLAFGGVGAF